ncbi:MAG: P-II family nitrogen regulator [Chloroflexi bacterium]|nr:P-II family nitrogen regulator [Chloroflexota bacterium]
MKQIVAYVEPNTLPSLTLALRKLENLPGLSVSEVREFGRDRIPQSNPPIVQELVDYTPHLRIEIFCADEQVFEIVWTIENAAHTGQGGDGKVYVLEVCQAVCIQAEEKEELAA